MFPAPAPLPAPPTPMSLSPPSLPYPPGCVFFPSSPVCVAHLPPLGVRPHPYKETRLTPGSYRTPKLLRVVGSCANSPISTPGFCLGGDHTGLVYAVTTATEFCAQLFSRVWKTPFPWSYHHFWLLQSSHPLPQGPLMRVHLFRTFQSRTALDSFLFSGCMLTSCIFFFFTVLANEVP